MARFPLSKLPKDQRIQLIGEFYDVIHSLKSRQEVREFFRDLLNPDEITMLMRRVEIAALLTADFTYENIQKLTGAGKATVTAVRRKLQRENGGKGYRTVISRLLEQRKKKIQTREKMRKVRESSTGGVKKRYPLAFLLMNVVDEIEAGRERKREDFTKRALHRTPSRR